MDRFINIAAGDDWKIEFNYLLLGSINLQDVDVDFIICERRTDYSFKLNGAGHQV